MLAKLWIRARLRPDSSMNRASFCSSIILFSCSMLFRFFSMEEICSRRHTSSELLLRVEQEAEGPEAHLSLQVDHVGLHLVVGLADVVDFFVQLLDVLIIVQNYRQRQDEGGAEGGPEGGATQQHLLQLTIAGSELGAQVVVRGELGLLLGEQGARTSGQAADETIM